MDQMSKQHDRRTFRWFPLFLAGVIFLSFLAAGSVTSTATERSIVSVDGRIYPETESNSWNLIFVCPIQESAYWKNCVRGIVRADQELGVATTIIGPMTSEEFPDGVVNALQEAVEMHPDGILAYAGQEQMRPILKQAKQENIPVVAIDADAPDKNRIAYVGTNYKSIGQKAGNMLVQTLGPGTKIGILCTSPDISNETAVLNGFQDTIDDYEMEIVAQSEGGSRLETAEDAVRQMLREHPDIEAIFAIGGENAAGAGRCLQADRMEDTVTLIGMEDTEENLALLREGAIDALIVHSAEDMGYTGVNVMKEYLDEGILPQTIYNTEITLVTKGNIDTYHLKGFAPNTELKTVRVGYYNGDPSFQDGFSDDTRKSGYAYDYYQMIATINGWKYEYVYGSYEEILDMLRRGEIDIAAGVSRSERGKFYLSSTDIGIPGENTFFAVNYERPDLRTELDGAMQTIQNEKPTFTAELYSKYYGNVDTGTSLSEFELSYLSQLKEIRFGYVTSVFPLSAEDKNGNPIGLVSFLMQTVANFTRLPVQPVAFTTMEEMDRALTQNQVDVIFPNPSDIWMNEQKGFKETDSIVSDRVMLVYSGEYTDDLMLKVAINKDGIGQQYYMESRFPDSEVTEYDNRTQVFEAIEQGKERCTVGYSSVLQRFLFDHPEYDNLHIAYSSTTVKLCLSVNEHKTYLISVLNKAITQQGSAAINSALLSYTGMEKTVSFGQFVKQNSVVFILVLTGFLAIITILFVLYLRSAKRFQKHQKETNLALANALEKANEASEAKTNFLSSMSHDIRTPMNAIIGMAAIASQYSNDREKVQDCLDKITISGQHLLTLINDVLDISKIESGKLAMNPVKFSLSKMINDLLDIISTSAKQKGLFFETDVKDITHDTVLADKVRINQIFINLLSNAIKYTEPGGTITVRFAQTVAQDEKSAHIIFTVQDTGIGMSEEFMKTMYDSFSRAHDTRINRIQGAGLGLSIVKQMVDLMGGTILCESKEQAGTKFTVAFDVPIAEASIEEKTSKKPAESLEGMHLLVAEDNDLNWEVVSELLDFYQVSCDRAVNGKVCVDMLEAAKEGTYTLVLMDIQMPVMNGKEAAKCIRNSEREYVRKIPIIALSADSFAEDISECMEVGMNGHVSKPIDIEKLLQEIRKVLGEK